MHESNGHESHGHHAAGWPPLQVAMALSVLVFAVGLLWLRFPQYTLANVLEQARPAGILAAQPAALLPMVWPNEHDSHAPEIKSAATLIAFSTAISGFLLSTMFYGVRKLDPAESKRAFAPIYRFLLNKWWFDELYDFLFVRPVHVIAGWASQLDRMLIDGIIDGLAWIVRTISVFWDRVADRTIIDGLVNALARRTFGLGIFLRRAQTGNLRQYVLFIVVGTILVFVLTNVWRYALAQ
jgi:NADH-quinone oxidoreductase subunit L